MVDYKSQPEGDNDETFTTSLSMLGDLAEGSESAWSRFERRYRAWLMTHCQRSGLSEADADDVTQEVMFKIFQAIGDFDRQRNGSFRKWMLIVTRSRIADLFRKSKRNREEPCSESFVENAAAAANLEDQIDEPSVEALEEFERKMALLRSQFSDRDIEILIEYLGKDRLADDIAAEHGVSANAVYLVKSRVVKRIYGILNPDEE
ncbi:RNA polymerase sigma factor [Rubinisphaera margarita]|uniref:RNA polymerase sigma factor n=1 Tax=Rubinisphaera margarita TaxID=2909586 RepID=UPI001EE91833|nr:sigma-70 family RNA polymerase sigma factor [Rubinisphaera margarita]MCG6158262.1 sigma-70 family RNA polymerase sigma factor [Rubinisphaera margarita]